MFSKLFGGKKEPFGISKCKFIPVMGVSTSAAHAPKLQIKLEDDVVYRTTMREAAIIIEFGHIFRRVWRYWICMVRKRSAVSKHQTAGVFFLSKPKKIPRTDHSEASSLRFGVLARASLPPVHDTPADQTAIVGGVSKNLVRERVMPVRLSIYRRPIREKIVMRIHVIETIGKYELHDVLLDSR